MFKKLFIDHCQETENPQTYWTHGKFAAWNSLIIIYGGILGIIHAIFPFLFPFSTSTIIIKAFRKLVLSRRHIAELEREGFKDVDFEKMK